VWQFPNSLKVRREGSSTWRHDEIFSWEENKRTREGERTLHHETITQKRTWPRTKLSVVQIQSGAYQLYNACRLYINGRKQQKRQIPLRWFCITLGTTTLDGWWCNHMTYVWCLFKTHVKRSNRVIVYDSRPFRGCWLRIRIWILPVNLFFVFCPSHPFCFD
jgi:hypothetical protein